MRSSDTVAILFIITMLFFMPSQSQAKDIEFYTIQTGTFTALEAAEEEFDAVMLGLTGLNGMTLGYLRIEKIGEFYTVRIGKFMDYMSAQEFLHAARSQIAGAIILKAYYKKERIIQRFGEDAAVEDAETAEAPVMPVEPVKEDKTPLPQQPQIKEASQAPPGKEIETDELPLPKAEPLKEKDKEKGAMELQVSPETEPVEKNGILSDIRGRFYVSDYYSEDSSDYDFHVITGRINLYKREKESPGFYFEFDGRVRKKIIEGDIDRKVARYKVDEAWIGYKFRGLKLRAIGGRQYIQELYNTDIDGLNIKYSFKKGVGIGIFGGFAPDKFDDSLNDDYKSLGGYGFLNREHHKISLGYEHLTYNGETDREYFSLRAYSRVSKKIRFNALASVNENQISNDFELENANANLTYSHSRKLRFSIFGNYYRTIKYYESSKYYFEFSDSNENFLLDTNSQTRAGVRIDYKLARGLKVYGSTAYQHRKRDDEDSTRFTGGIRKYDLYGFDLSGRYTYIDNYSSRDNEYNFEIYRHIKDKFDISVYASYEETKLDLENAYTTGSRTYGASLYWPMSKRFYTTMFVEYLDEEDYSSISVYTQLGYKLIP